MKKETKFDYDEGLDIFHIYTSEIDLGIKGGINYGNFNIDIGNDDKVVGVELEGASNILNMPPETLINLDSASLIVRKEGNMLFIGFSVIKGGQNSTIQINVPIQNSEIKVTN